MTKERKDAIEARLAVLPLPALRPFVSSLASVGAALFNAFGDAAGKPLVQEAVSALWDAADPRRLKALSKELRGLPELRAIDSHRIDYHAGVGLDFVRRALQVSASSNRTRTRKDLGVLAHDVRGEMDGYDFALTGREARIKLPDQPPAPGGLEEGEIERQLSALNRLAADSGEGTARDIRADAERFAARVQRDVAPWRAILGARYPGVPEG